MENWTDIGQPLCKGVMTLTLVAVGSFGSTDVHAESILGFSELAAKAQRDIEIVLDENISSDEMDEWLRYMSEFPHHVGSSAGKRNVIYIAELLESWGYSVEIVEYSVLFPTPKRRAVSLVAPVQFEASLVEAVVPGDTSTEMLGELLPPYNAFSIDGDVSGELVFVNYGLPEDYETLERYGVNVDGKIVIARYGRAWRGTKPKLAADKGAIGTLLYSDPADDGFVNGDVYPSGPFKNDTAVERGSVMEMPVYPGDVLTPDRAATKDANRLSREEAITISKIPVLPISYSDALPLLAELGGSVVPPQWRGGLPTTYHFGPGPAQVRIEIESNWDFVTAYNVVAHLEGSTYPTEWVIRGNHHDAWNHGASDPLSGLVAMLAEAKAVATLARQGRRPLRTIIYAAWDAEEPGLIGSTEWVEQNAETLKSHGVAYLNTDSTSRGFVQISGSHVLERFFNEIINEIDDPKVETTLLQRIVARNRIEGNDPYMQANSNERAEMQLSPLGLGSDYTAFLQHLGIASAHIRFGGEAANGSYHTLYDTYEHYTTWQDPRLVYGATLAKVVGRATLRLANAQRLPFEFSGFARNINLYITNLEELADEMREDTVRLKSMIEDGTYDVGLDPSKKLEAPALQNSVPFFNFALLKNTAEQLRKAAERYDEALKLSCQAASRELNELLYTSERLLTDEEGLAGRPWYKHRIYAPDFHTGYGVEMIPEVREAIKQRKFESVDKRIAAVAIVLQRFTRRVDQLIVKLGEECANHD